MKSPWGGSGGVKIVQGERRLDRVRIQPDVDTEVINAMAKKGADIICDVNHLAKGDSAIRERTIEFDS